MHWPPQTCGSQSLFTPFTCGSWGSNLGSQACVEMPLPAKPSHLPLKTTNESRRLGRH